MVTERQSGCRYNQHNVVESVRDGHRFRVASTRFTLIGKDETDGSAGYPIEPSRSRPDKFVEWCHGRIGDFESGVQYAFA